MSKATAVGFDIWWPLWNANLVKTFKENIYREQHHFAVNVSYDFAWYMHSANSYRAVKFCGKLDLFSLGFYCFLMDCVCIALPVCSKSSNFGSLFGTTRPPWCRRCLRFKQLWWILLADVSSRGNLFQLHVPVDAFIPTTCTSRCIYSSCMHQ